MVNINDSVFHVRRAVMSEAVDVLEYEVPIQVQVSILVVVVNAGDEN